MDSHLRTQECSNLTRKSSFFSRTVSIKNPWAHRPHLRSINTKELLSTNSSHIFAWITCNHLYQSCWINSNTTLLSPCATGKPKLKLTVRLNYTQIAPFTILGGRQCPLCLTSARMTLRTISGTGLWYCMRKADFQIMDSFRTDSSIIFECLHWVEWI